MLHVAEEHSDYNAYVLVFQLGGMCPELPMLLTDLIFGFGYIIEINMN